MSGCRCADSPRGLDTCMSPSGRARPRAQLRPCRHVLHPPRPLPPRGAIVPLTPGSCARAPPLHTAPIQVDVLDASDAWAWLGAWEPIHISMEWVRYTVAVPVEASRAGNHLDGAPPTRPLRSHHHLVLCLPPSRLATT